MIKPLFIAALLATGGSQVAAQSLVGKWDCAGRGGPNMAIRTLQNYGPAGGFNHLANVALSERGQRFDMAVALRGIWKGEGAVLVENIQNVRIRSVAVNGKDITTTPIGKQMARILRAEFTKPNRPSRIRLDALSKDKMSFVDGPFKADCTKR